MTTTQRIFTLASTALVLLLIYLLQPILTPFLVAFILAYLGDPLVDKLEAMRVGRTLGVVIVFLVFLVVAVMIFLVVVPVALREMAALVAQIPTFILYLQEVVSPILVERFNVDPFDIKVDELGASLAGNWQQAGGVARLLISEVTRSSLALFAWVANFALIPVVAFYLLRDWDLLVRNLRELLPRDVEATVVSLVRECDEVLGAFLRGQLLIMFLLGCAYAMGLMAIGVDLAVLIGMVAGLASIVPYLGFAVGLTVALIAGVFQFQEVMPLVWIAVVFGVGQLLEGMVLTPLLVGDRIGLHPVAVIFAVLAGGQLFGFVGVLLALPAAAVVMVFVRYLHVQYKRSDIYEQPD